MANDVRMTLDELLRRVQLNCDVDFLRDGLRVFSQALVELEVSQELGAAPSTEHPVHGLPEWLTASA